MNKLLKSIVAATVGVAMAIGAGVGLGREAKAVYADNVYTLVTSSDSLSEGDNIIIGYNAATPTYLSSTQNNNNRAATTDTASAELILLEQNGDYWSLHATTTSGYLYAASSSKNYLRTQATNNDNGKWEITIDSNGIASIIAQGTNTRNVMQYNSSDSLFSCYGSASQKNVSIWKVTSGGETPDPVHATNIELNKTSSSLFVGDTEELTASLTPNDSTDTVSWSSSDESVAVVSRGVVTAKAAGSAVVSAEANGHTASCTFTVSEYEEIEIANALTVINGLSDGAKTQHKYHITGYVNEVTHRGSDAISYTLGSSVGADSLLTIYDSSVSDIELIAKLKQGDQVSVIGKLEKFVKSGNITPEVVNAVTTRTASAPAVDEPVVGTRTIAQFIAGDNTKTLAYYVTGTIKEWRGNDGAKDMYGNFILTDGENDLLVYGASATSTALMWNDVDSYVFTNPHDFLTNAQTASLELNWEITMKLIRCDYTKDGNTTLEGCGVIIEIHKPASSNGTFDLTTNNTKTCTETEISWQNSNCSIVCEKGNASTNANNYVGGEGNYTSTRFYKNSILTITPSSSISIVKVEFAATTASYANALNTSTWSNATSSVSNTIVTVVPNDHADSFSATIGGTCGFTSINVYCVDLSSAVSIKTIRGNAILEDGNVTAVNSLTLRFGAKISEEAWNVIKTDGNNITEYGVKMFLTNSPASAPTVESRGDSVATVSREVSVAEPDKDGQGNYNFLAAITIPDTLPDGNFGYNSYFCVRPYLVIGGQTYWLLNADMKESIVSLAKNNDGTNLSEDALDFLKAKEA